MASLPQNQDVYDGMGFDPGAAMDSSLMTRITPDQLPGFLNASSSSASDIAMLGGATAVQGRPGASQMPGYGSSVRSTTPGMSSAITGQRSVSGSDFSREASNLNLQASLEMPRRQGQVSSAADMNLDRPQIRHRADPYANIPSLYDLYLQVSQRPAVLEHFGENIFRNGIGNSDRLPMDLPAGPDYVLGPGDGVSIDIWGGVAQRLLRVVDPSGRLALPEVGTVNVSGRALGDVQRLVQAALRSQFHEVEADVSLARIRSVRGYVLGEVENPGPYDISSLSTPLNALYAAGGPTSRGSLRHLRLYPGKNLIQEVEAYDFLLHGVQNEDRLQSGDTLDVPPAGPQIAVYGAVKRPAIYE